MLLIPHHRPPGCTTAFKATEQQSTFFLSLVADGTGKSFVITGEQGFIEYVNPTFSQLKDHQAQDVVGRKRRVSASPAPALAKFRSAALPEARAGQSDLSARALGFEDHQKHRPS